MNILSDIDTPLHISDVRHYAVLAHDDHSVMDLLFDAMQGTSKRAADNAAWALTHLPSSDVQHIAPRRAMLVELAIHTPDTALRRLTLNLLEKLDWPEEEIRTDLLDFCLAHLTMPSEAAGVRALCAKLAWYQCRHYPELTDEFRRTLLFLEPENLSAGLRHCRKTLLGECTK